MPKASKADLIAYLHTLPDDVELKVICTEIVGWDTCAYSEDMDLDLYTGNVDLLDLRGNQFIKSDNPNYNKVTVIFGQS